MFSPQVTLRSGGYIVINQTEALVSIDVNSGRSTREHNIEDTALQTNLEAAEEIARQLRLRDLAGLIVIDFIDMEEKRNNRSVERKMKDALKNDRARIQVGRISHFGLLEMSRQRIRTGVLESTTTTCPTCQGTGHVRAPASVALHVLRALEDQLQRGVTHHLTIRTRTVVALYILNQKRQHLAEIEARFGLHVTVAADESITNGAHFAIERGEPVEPRTITQTSVTMASVHVVEDDITDAEETAEATEQDVGDLEAIDGEEHESRESREGGDERGEREGGRRRRRRRGRGRGGEGRQEGGQRNEARGGHEGQPAHRHEPRAPEGDANPEGDDGDEGTYEEGRSLGGADNGLGPDGEPRKRRRGRRGGRRGRRGRGNGNGENRQPGTGGAQQPGEGAYASDEDASDRQPAFPQTYGLLNGDDEIDTTPRIEPAPAREAAPQPTFVRNRFAEPVDEIDTTPLPEPRPAPASASEPRPEPAAEQKPDAEPEPEDPNRPKRSGWWQRRSFFG
jgi:ribonuclease E